MARHYARNIGAAQQRGRPDDALRLKQLNIHTGTGTHRAQAILAPADESGLIATPPVSTR